jgi:hypothetical protein
LYSNYVLWCVCLYYYFNLQYGACSVACVISALMSYPNSYLRVTKPTLPILFPLKLTTEYINSPSYVTYPYWNVKENTLECKHTGGNPAFGSDVGPDKRYMINEHEAEAVRTIYNMLACGSTTREVKTWLDNNGYKTKYNTSFTTGTINTLVRNEKYKGVYVYGKEKRIIENGVKKISPVMT